MRSVGWGDETLGSHALTTQILVETNGTIHAFIYVSYYLYCTMGNDFMILIIFDQIIIIVS